MILLSLIIHWGRIFISGWEGVSIARRLLLDCAVEIKGRMPFLRMTLPNGFSEIRTLDPPIGSQALESLGYWLHRDEEDLEKQIKESNKSDPKSTLRILTLVAKTQV